MKKKTTLFGQESQNELFTKNMARKRSRVKRKYIQEGDAVCLVVLEVHHVLQAPSAKSNVEFSLFPKWSDYGE